MEILFKIKDLLEKSNQVELPGLGIFYKKRTEGFFDKNNKTYFPPKETIEFSTVESSSESNSNNVLIDFIAYSKHVSQTSASYILAKQVENIKNELDNNNDVYIQGIGKLKKQKDTILLELENQTISSNAFFGLPTFKIQKEDTQKEIFVEKTEIPTEFSLAEQALSASTANEDIDAQEKPKSKLWLYILLLIMIIGLSISAIHQYRPELFNSIINQLEKKTEKPEPLTEEEKETAIADSIYKDDIVKNLESSGFEVENVKDTTNITIKKKAAPNNNNLRYEIIIAAWQTKAKAEEHLKLLRANGINAHIIDDGGLMIKISTATLYNKEDADKELKRVREELNPEAFYKAFKNLN